MMFSLNPACTHYFLTDDFFTGEKKPLGLMSGLVKSTIYLFDEATGKRHDVSLNPACTHYFLTDEKKPLGLMSGLVKSTM
ncbi:hypothetical protein QNI23_014625 [Bermanella sp. WJH001]|uniref:hypothetical protein n=1 Tax=Bermanella sp. WJH001 TaxID=3048005 RepID=UPI0024BDCC24|nr:hypothetical protein [Bermanella sp. WJH001]MDJ1539329.1 hypothetical protein [Bermanella sp. WJH001]